MPPSFVTKQVGRSPFRSVRGLWQDLGISLSPEEIEMNQRDMWRNCPNEDTLMPAIVLGGSQLWRVDFQPRNAYSALHSVSSILVYSPEA
jgi:hypothetical protein